MIYKLFKNKEDIYSNLMKEKAQSFHNSIISVFSSRLDPIKKLRNLASKKVQTVLKNKDFVKLYLAEASGASFDIRLGMTDEIRKLYEEYLDMLTEVFKEGVKKDIFKPLSPHRMAVSFDSILNSMLMDHIEKGMALDEEEVLTIFLEGVKK